MKAAHEKLGRPCDMCANYEAQLVSSQTTMLDAVASKDAAEKAMNEAEERLEKEKTLRQVSTVFTRLVLHCVEIEDSILRHYIWFL